MFESYNLKVFGNKEGIKYNVIKPKHLTTPKREVAEDILHEHLYHCSTTNHDDGSTANKKLMK